MERLGEYVMTLENWLKRDRNYFCINNNFKYTCLYEIIKYNGDKIFNTRIIYDKNELINWVLRKNNPNIFKFVKVIKVEKKTLTSFLPEIIKQNIERF